MSTDKRAASADFLRDLILNDEQAKLLIALVDASSPNGSAWKVDRRAFATPAGFSAQTYERTLQELQDFGPLPNGRRLLMFNRLEVIIDPEGRQLADALRASKQTDTIKERFVIACFEFRNGGHFDWREIAKDVGLRPEAADDLINYYFKELGYVTPIHGSTTALFEERGVQFVKALVAKRDEERAQNDFVTKQLAHAAIDKQRKLTEALSDQERLYLLALERHVGLIWQDVRRFIPDPDQITLDSLKDRRLIDPLPDGRPGYWKLTEEGRRLLPWLHEWATKRREQSQSEMEARVLLAFVGLEGASRTLAELGNSEAVETLLAKGLIIIDKSGIRDPAQYLVSLTDAGKKKMKDDPAYAGHQGVQLFGSPESQPEVESGPKSVSPPPLALPQYVRFLSAARDMYDGSEKISIAAVANVVDCDMENALQFVKKAARDGIIVSRFDDECHFSAWGRNHVGELLTGAERNRKSTPTAISSIPIETASPPDDKLSGRWKTYAKERKAFLKWAWRHAGQDMKRGIDVRVYAKEKGRTRYDVMSVIDSLIEKEYVEERDEGKAENKKTRDNWDAPNSRFIVYFTTAGIDEVDKYSFGKHPVAKLMVDRFWGWIIAAIVAGAGLLWKKYGPRLWR